MKYKLVVSRWRWRCACDCPCLRQTTVEGDGLFTYGDLTGEGTVIYVVDSGVFLDHPEFGGKQGPSRAVWGADCTSGSCLSTFPPADEGAAFGDCNGHGTHVAGIAAGRCGLCVLQVMQ